MSESVPTLAIIVLNYNTPDLTKRLIDSINEFAGGVDFETIVVDNNSRENLRYRAESGLESVRLIQLNHNLGFGRAVNLAAGQSTAPFLLLANSDCCLHEDIFTEMLKFMRENDKCAACSPQLVFPDGCAHSSIRRTPDYRNIRRSRGSLLKSAANSDSILPADESRKEVEAMAATFMMLRHETFAQIGGFDERFFMYAEDLDLCLRLRKLGRNLVYLGDLTVTHLWGGSTRLQTLRMKLEHHRSIMQYFLKHNPGRTLANLALVLQLGINMVLLAIKVAWLRREP